MADFKQNLALVLSGGGAKGAFQVGAMEELILKRGVDFEIFGGVSTGAIQAVGGAQNQIKELKELWLGIKKNSDIYKKRWGLIGGLLGNDSLYRPNGLKEKLNAFVSPPKLKQTGKKLLVGAVSLQTGEFGIYREDNPEIANWVYASTAVPMAFPTLRKNGDKFVDGGVRNITPLSSVMDLEPSAVVIVLASPLQREPKMKKFKNLIKIAKRAVEILENEVFRTDIAKAKLINDLVKAYAGLETQANSLNLSLQQRGKLLAPFKQVLEDYKLVNIVTIEPEKLFSSSLEFNPQKIRTAIKAGKTTVEKKWKEIENAISK